MKRSQSCKSLDRQKIIGDFPAKYPRARGLAITPVMTIAERGPSGPDCVIAIAPSFNRTFGIIIVRLYVS